jgi:chaperonin cofactor prefoldin
MNEAKRVIKTVGSFLGEATNLSRITEKIMTNKFEDIKMYIRTMSSTMELLNKQMDNLSPEELDKVDTDLLGYRNNYLRLALKQMNQVTKGLKKLGSSYQNEVSTMIKKRDKK